MPGSTPLAISSKHPPFLCYGLFCRIRKARPLPRMSKNVLRSTSRLGQSVSSAQLSPGALSRRLSPRLTCTLELEGDIELNGNEMMIRFVASETELTKSITDKVIVVGM